MKKNSNSVPFKLLDITTEQFAVFQENHEVGNYEFDIDLKTTVNISSEQKVVGILTKYSFSQKAGIVVVLECGCHFELDENYWNDNIDNNILTLDKGLLTHFLVLTVGTSRGVLHVKKPKWLENMMLPTLNVTSVINENAQFDLTIEEAKEEEE